MAENRSIPPEPGTASAPRRPSRWTVQVTALSVALVALLTTSGWLLRTGADTDAATQRRAAVDAATAVALELSSIDMNNAAARLDSLANLTTGEFHDQLGGNSAFFQQVLRMGNVSSRGTVTAAGVEAIGADRATVLVALRAQVANTQIPAGQSRGYRLAVWLDYVSGRWLASKVDYVG